MRQAAELLEEFGVDHECRVLSAHRTPAETAEYAGQAESRGIEVIDCGRGRGRAPGRCVRRAYAGAGAGRSHGERHTQGVGFAALDGADAGRDSRGHPGHRRGRGAQRGAAGSCHSGQQPSGIARAAAAVSRQAERESAEGDAAVKRKMGIMYLTRRSAMGLLAGAIPAARRAAAQPATGLEIQKGPFVGTRESLKAYRVPEWFRDAKFGIWAHWGPQSAPEQGDWYARKMYIEGDRSTSGTWSTSAIRPSSASRM